MLKPKMGRDLNLFLVCFVLTACTQPENFAPVVERNIPFQPILAPEPNAPVKRTVVVKKPFSETLTSEALTAQDKTIAKNKSPVKIKENAATADNRFYLVQASDTLFSIARMSGISAERLVMWNRLKPPHYLEVGQKLRLFEDRRQKKVQERKTLAETKSDNPTEEKKSAISNVNKKVLKLNWQWPIRGKIVKNFLQSGKGIDIKAKTNQQVKAAEAGEVVYGGQGLIGYGNLLIIQHNKDFLSAYGNNSTLLVEEGQQVEKGQAIAEIEKAGNGASVLHFEIRKQGKSVNPLKFLPK